MPASRSASGPGIRLPRHSASPAPTKGRKACAREARSASPRLPVRRTSGCTPAFNMSRSVAAKPGETPEAPRARPASRTNSMARTSSRASGSPTPTARAATARCWKLVISSAGSRVSTAAPRPGGQAVDRSVGLRVPVDDRPRRFEPVSHLGAEDDPGAARHRHHVADGDPAADRDRRLAFARAGRVGGAPPLGACRRSLGHRARRRRRQGAMPFAFRNAAATWRGSFFSTST